MPNLSILGIGPKQSAQPEPPAFGGSAPDDSLNSPDLGASGGDLTPDMLNYHGSDQNCGSCSHFSAPSTCDRWPDPVEDGGWCRGWQGGAETETPAEDLAPDEGSEPPAMPGA